MKRLTSLITLILIALTSAMAQPIAVSQAAKSVFTLTTFKKDGSILASSHGAFISADGTAISHSLAQTMLWSSTTRGSVMT